MRARKTENIQAVITRFMGVIHHAPSIARTSRAMTNKRERGNAMIYVLVALALFGFLTMTLSRSGDQADGQDISDEQAEFYAQELMQYAASAQQAVDMMIISGSSIDELDFVTPDDAAFNTPPNIHKVYHPQGGGLNYVEKFNDNIADDISAFPQWYVINISHIEWTPSNKNDVILSALRIKKEICQIINKKITGSTDIPIISSLGAVFDPAIYSIDLDSSSCPNCIEKNNICVTDSGQTRYGYYNIIAAQ